MEVQVDADARWRWRLRAEGVRVEYAWALPVEHGWLCFADLRCILPHRSAVSMRLTAFRTESYDSRVYAGESDLPGIVGSRMYHGTGVRGYAMLTLHPLSGLRCTLRYERMLRLDMIPLGSGRDAVDGPSLGVWALQVEAGLPGT
jgi:hypothetical protein